MSRQLQPMLLDAIVTAQDDVREATRRRHRAFESRTSSTEELVDARRTESRAIAERERWLAAAANHLRSRPHAVAGCPVCEQFDSQGVNHDVVHPDDGNK